MEMTIQAIVENISTRRDGSIKLVFGVNELPANESAILFTMANKMGWLAFSSDYIENQVLEELSKKPIDIEGGKSLSQRERGVLFVLWDKKGRIGDFEDFRKKHVEKFINKIKEEIDKYN
jgi:hypothetical protein